MAFENIKDISRASIETNRYYFIDTNVWVYAMNSHCLGTGDKGNRIYTDFFFKIAESEDKPRPRILLCGLLLSEILNTYLKKYAMPDYIHLEFDRKGRSRPDMNDFYKRQYRKSDHFKRSYDLIVDEIKTYHQNIEMMDDCFKSLKPFQLMKECPQQQDFNDFYYYQLCKEFNKNNKKANFSFITNDGDFKVQEFEILTANAELLALRQADSKK